MSLPPESRQEAIARLNKSASDLESRNQSQLAHELAGQKAAGQAWRILADLLGGVFVGLILGLLLDRFVGIAPWGTLGGVLAGFAVSLWMGWRTSQRLMAEARASGVEPQSVPFEDENQGD